MISQKRNIYNKPTNTNKILGADYETIKYYMENKFNDGMNWGNHGKWHIDHITPLASAKKNELIKLCHYTNLQPLWAKDNMIKSEKII